MDVRGDGELLRDPTALDDSDGDAVADAETRADRVEDGLVEMEREFAPLVESVAETLGERVGRGVADDDVETEAVPDINDVLLGDVLSLAD